jgi:hypothetical protein
VEFIASAVVGAVQAYAWIDQSQQINLNELFDQMSQKELEDYAREGTLPGWFTQIVGATAGDSQENENANETYETQSPNSNRTGASARRFCDRLRQVESSG